MFYIKNEKFSESLFENPTKEYRGMPFWAWNAKLNQEELNEQIDIFKEMGFGGFFMHVRQGLETEYLSDEFLSAIKNCTQKADSVDMYACLYDEDRWPSGAAGGIITKNKKNRLRYLNMTTYDLDNDEPTKEDALINGKPYFLAAFDIKLDKNGLMTEYRRIARDEKSENKRYFFSNVRQGGEPRYNLQSYSDTLNKGCVNEFINTTYTAFENSVGEYFGEQIPFIFTDEPQTFQQIVLQSGFSNDEAMYAWTMDFDDTYKHIYGDDILDKLPELFFCVDGDWAAKTRYNYYRHISERFCDAYMDNIGAWCSDKNIMFTGHVFGEDSLDEMVRTNCDVMRTYKNMQFPGIDVLFNDRCFQTAIQCRSIVRQYSKEGMLSELYGVTGWDFDFKNHKFQGDWQAALGVTLRVPHLAWQTMKGEGKRDYPASIFYQSPWHKEYKIIEDHYGRLASVLTRGTPNNKTAVIHPIESYWTLKGARAESKDLCEEMESHFKELSTWLLNACVDFDYIGESVFEDLCKDGTYPMQVGAMKYETIIVSDCITLRPYTIKMLEQFKKSGGRLIIMGRTPYMSLGVVDEDAKKIGIGAINIQHSKPELYNIILQQQDVLIKNSNGEMSDNLLCTVKNDNEEKWMFIAHSKQPELGHITTEQKIVISIKGCFKPILYNTFNGEKVELEYVCSKNETKIFCTIYDFDSLLIRLLPCGNDLLLHKDEEKNINRPLSIEGAVNYSLFEQNVIVLDMAEYSLNGEPWQEKEEILRIDNAIREKLGLEVRKFKVVQPWAVKNSTEKDVLRLRYRIYSEIEIDELYLAMENVEKARIVLNNEEIANRPCGFYVDRYIKKIPLTKLVKGENILEITIPFGERTDIENCYLVGCFGVVVKGDFSYIVEKPKKIRFGDISNQGFAFYGGNINYEEEINLKDDAVLEFEISHYRGALIKVLIDGTEQGNIIIPPYKLRTKIIKRGCHKVQFILYGNRYNTFSSLHTLLADKKRVYIGPIYWRHENDAWAYEYQLRPMGILKKPIINIIEKEKMI